MKASMTSTRRISLVRLIVLVTLCAAALSLHAAKAPNDQERLANLNMQCLKAFDAKQDSTLDKIEASDFDISTDEGVLTKAKQLEGVRASKNDVYPIHREVLNQVVRVYGDAAVITELDHAWGDGGGSSKYQTSSFWVRHNGEWQIVHMHYSKVE